MSGPAGASPRRAGLAPWPAVAFGVGLAVLNNWLGWVGVRRYGHVDGGFLRANLPLAGALLLWTVVRGESAAVGWRACSGRRLAVGAATGFAMGLPPALAFCFPVGLHRGPIRFDLVGRMSSGRFLRKILVELPLVTAIPEELAFRGVLEAGLRRHVGPLAAAAVSALAFTAGHGAIHHYSLKATKVDEVRVPETLKRAGMLVSVYVGGLLFSLLRARTGSLWPAILAHWAVDAVMLGAFFWVGHRRSR